MGNYPIDYILRQGPKLLSIFESDDSRDYSLVLDGEERFFEVDEFMNQAKREFAQAKKNNGQLSLLIMDLDNFKIINDTFGHAAGDEMIREMGSIIRSSFPKTDIVGRVGGEEFAVILKNASLEDAKKEAEQFRQSVAEKKVFYGEHEISITVSIGIASISGSCTDICDIEDTADAALYKAKAKGRNCVVASEPGT